jgi:Flp pilus assembly secretin CpaC
VGDGQTLIMGGLIKNKETKGETKVPILGDIPGLGYLFKSKKDTRNKTELLIFISPRIINSEEIKNSNTLRESFVKEASGSKMILEKASLADELQAVPADSPVPGRPPKISESRVRTSKPVKKVRPSRKKEPTPAIAAPKPASLGERDTEVQRLLDLFDK